MGNKAVGSYAKRQEGMRGNEDMAQDKKTENKDNQQMVFPSVQPDDGGAFCHDFFKVYILWEKLCLAEGWV